MRGGTDGCGARGLGLAVNLMSGTQCLQVVRPQSGLPIAMHCTVWRARDGHLGYTSSYGSCQHGGEGVRDLSVYQSTQMLRDEVVQKMK